MGHNTLNFSLIYRLVDTFSFSPGQVGVFIAIGQISYFLGCTLYHRFGSTASPVTIIPAASIVVLLASIPLGFIKVLGSAYASYWLIQLGSSFFWPPLSAWITEGLSGVELSRKISIYNRSWMAALIIAPPIAGFLYRWNSSVNFIVIALCFFINFFFVLSIKRTYAAPAAEKEKAAHTAEITGNDKHNLSPLQQNKILDLYRYTAWIGLFCSVMLAGILMNIVPIHIRDTLGFTESTAGWVLFARCVSGFIAFIILAKFTAWNFILRWLIIIQAGLVFCAFLFLIAGSRLSFYYVVVVLFGLINASCNTNSLFYSRATGKNPKKNLALHEMFTCTGNAAGSAGGGLVYQNFGFAGTCFALMLALGAGLAGLILLNRIARKNIDINKIL